MTATATARTALDSFREAVEGKDSHALEACYAEDAVAVHCSERSRPSSAEELRGRRAIAAGYSDAPPDLKHEIQDEVADDERFACTIKCTYPNGGLVFSTVICDVADGLIVREFGVDAWDE